MQVDVPLLDIYKNTIPVDLPLVLPNGIKIYQTADLDGGGTAQYPDFIEVLNKFGKHYKHCLEWCAGHGIIGFSVLDTNLCDKVTFIEKYLPAMYVGLLNIAHNNLFEKANFYLLDAIHKLPTTLKFDLVVSNPPHSPVYNTPSEDEPNFLNNLRINEDTDWQAHKEFFNSITSYLLPNADILLSQIMYRDEHIKFAENNGIKFIGSYEAPKLASQGGCTTACIMHYRYLGY